VKKKNYFWAVRVQNIKTFGIPTMKDQVQNSYLTELILVNPVKNPTEIETFPPFHYSSSDAYFDAVLGMFLELFGTFFACFILIGVK
jgi:hypothetical protein